VTNNEKILSQNYQPLNSVTARMLIGYHNKLTQAIKDKDHSRIATLISVIAVLNPIEYILYLEKRKKNVEK
jgi:hypothetical protein